jgi:hypothetical protein
VVDKLGSDGASAGIEVWTEHLGGQLALIGLGDLYVEQWGRALVLRVKGAPQGTTSLLEGVLAGSLRRGLSRQVDVLAFDGDAETSFSQ